MDEPVKKEGGNGKPPAPVAADVPPDPAWPTFANADEIRLFPDDHGRVHLRFQDRVTFPNVKVRRAFPLSQPRRYLGFADSRDETITILRNPKGLDADSARIIREELRKRYLGSVILDVYSMNERYGVSHWKVLTDRGATEFDVRGLRDNIHDLGPRRLLIIDVDGNRYEIPDYGRLSVRARRQIERLI
jgi:hypothetical protein